MDMFTYSSYIDPDQNECKKKELFHRAQERNRGGKNLTAFCKETKVDPKMACRVQ